MERPRYPLNMPLYQRLDDAAARHRRGTQLERESFVRRPRKAGTTSATWKSEDDDMLRGMERLGASATRIAAALNRDTDTVRARALFLGCPWPTVSDEPRLKQYDLTGRSE